MWEQTAGNFDGLAWAANKSFPPIYSTKMLFNKLDSMGGFVFPKMTFPAIHFPKFPKMDMSKAGAQESMTATTSHCVNGVCDSKVILLLFPQLMKRWTVFHVTFVSQRRCRV